MFTGIIEKKARILYIKNGKFTVENHFPGELKLGQSVAHDGACMTIDSFDDSTYSFFAMEESLKKTNYGDKSPGDYFNVERCMQVSDRIDGHFVSGHIDTTGKVSLIDRKDDDSLLLGFSFHSDFSKYIIEKGSISINGVSLTVVEKREGFVSVSLIPLTQDWTNLGKLILSERVNIEFDMLGKYILNK